MAQLVKILVIRPHPVAGADSSKRGHASEGPLVYILLKLCMDTLLVGKFMVIV